MMTNLINSMKKTIGSAQVSQTTIIHSTINHRKDDFVDLHLRGNDDGVHFNIKTKGTVFNMVQVDDKHMPKLIAMVDSTDNGSDPQPLNNFLIKLAIDMGVAK